MTEKRSRGRPSTFRPEFVEQVQKLAAYGATEFEIARFFKKSDSGWKKWKHLHPELVAALKLGKTEPDDRVERSLYTRAVGYSFQSEKVFQFQGQVIRAKTVEHVPPDTTAGIFWLKNRRPDEWRDKVNHELSGGVKVSKAADLTDEQLAAIAAGQVTNG